MLENIKGNTNRKRLRPCANSIGVSAKDIAPMINNKNNILARYPER